MYLQTCRFCHRSNYDYTIRSYLLRYAPRHSAHLACLHAAGRLRDILLKLRPFELGKLPALELQDLGILDLVLQNLEAQQKQPQG